MKLYSVSKKNDVDRLCHFRLVSWKITI